MPSLEKALVVGYLSVFIFGCLGAVIAGYIWAELVLRQCVLSVSDLMLCLALVGLGVVGTWVGVSCVYDAAKR